MVRSLDSVGDRIMMPFQSVLDELLGSLRMIHHGSTSSSSDVRGLMSVTESYFRRGVLHEAGMCYILSVLATMLTYQGELVHED